MMVSVTYTLVDAGITNTATVVSNKLYPIPCIKYLGYLKNGNNIYTANFDEVLSASV